MSRRRWGLGALQINSGLARLEIAPYGVPSQLLIMGGIGVLFIVSAMTPLDKGIRFLSSANMMLAAALLLLVLIAGPTAFIFGELTQTAGEEEIHQSVPEEPGCEAPAEGGSAAASSDTSQQ